MQCEDRGVMKRAIVTGSTRGIGRAIGIELLQTGYEVAFNYAYHQEQAELLQNELAQMGFWGRYQMIQADLSQPEGIDRLTDQLEPRFHSLDALILNAATTQRGSLQELTYESWERILRTNLTIPLFLVQRCAPWLRSDGCILFLGAVMGQFPHAMSLGYGTSKAALHYLTRALVKEFSERQVRVNCVAPGFVETDWQIDKPREIRQSIESKIALHRFATPEEVAQCACSVLENTYINGSIINVDGGYCFQ